MPRIHVGELTVPGVHPDHEAGEIRSAVMVLEQPVRDAPDQLARIARFGDDHPEHRPDGSENQRRRDALPGHIADEHQPAPSGQADKIIEIAADRSCLHEASGPLQSIAVGRGRRKQPTLNVCGDGQLRIEHDVLTLDAR